MDIKNQIVLARQIRDDLGNLDLSKEEVKAFFLEKYAPGAKGMTDIEIADYIATCIRDEAIPNEDIFPIRFGNRPAVYVHSIHWMTRKANESGDFVGFTDPEYEDSQGNWHKGTWPFGKETAPVACRIGIIRKSTDKIAYSIVRWDERARYFGGQLGEQWRKDGQGIHMITKCCKAQAFRDGGFKGLSGKYLHEELDMEMPSGEWRNPPDPEKSNIENAVEAGRVAAKRSEVQKNFRHGDLRATEDQPIGKEQWENILREFKRLGIPKTEYLSEINALLKTMEVPTIKTTNDLTVIQAAEIHALLMTRRTETAITEPADTEAAG